MAINGAPKVRGEHVLSPEIEREVCEYYGVAA
jgi:hypothetical protein